MHRESLVTKLVQYLMKLFILIKVNSMRLLLQNPILKSMTFKMCIQISPYRKSLPTLVALVRFFASVSKLCLLRPLAVVKRFVHRVQGYGRSPV